MAFAAAFSFPAQAQDNAGSGHTALKQLPAPFDSIPVEKALTAIRGKAAGTGRDIRLLDAQPWGDRLAAIVATPAEGGFDNPITTAGECGLVVLASKDGTLTVEAATHGFGAGPFGCQGASVASIDPKKYMLDGQRQLLAVTVTYLTPASLGYQRSLYLFQEDRGHLLHVFSGVLDYSCNSESASASSKKHANCVSTSTLDVLPGSDGPPKIVVTDLSRNHRVLGTSEFVWHEKYLSATRLHGRKWRFKRWDGSYFGSKP